MVFKVKQPVEPAGQCDRVGKASRGVRIPRQLCGERRHGLHDLAEAVRDGILAGRGMIEIRQLSPRQLVQVQWQGFHPNLLPCGLLMGNLLLSQLTKLLHESTEVDAASKLDQQSF